MLLALLFMRFEAIHSLRKLYRRLEKRRHAREIREICEFIGDRTPKRNTFTLFIGRASPTLIEGIFTELRDQAFNMGIVDKDGSVNVSVDSTFMKAYSRRGPKGGKSDRGARVGKTDRRNCELGWRAHTATSMSAFPLTYVVRAANVNDKNMVKPLLKQAPRLLACYGKRISHVIADRQYYSSEAFSILGK